MATKLEAVAALKTLRGFIGDSQLQVIGHGTRGEEKQYFFDTVAQLAETVKAMPKTYEQESLGDQAIVHLHYFRGNMDFWITEKDCEEEQFQAFGLARMGGDAELGYINIVELISNNVELDFHWKPKTLAEIRKGKP